MGVYYEIELCLSVQVYMCALPQTMMIATWVTPNLMETQALYHYHLVNLSCMKWSTALCCGWSFCAMHTLESLQ